MSNKPQKSIPALPYPLSRKTRLAIMLTLIGIFLALTPIILMYARGYTYDFSARQLIHGGALSIETMPRDVKISLNGIVLKDMPPVRLPNIIPGNYHVKIEKDGYFTWEKDISLVSNQTTYLHDIDLFPQYTPEVAVAEAQNIVTFFASPTTNVILFLKKQGENYEISLYNPSLQQESAVTKLLSSTLPQVEWSPNGELVRIESQHNDEKSIILLNPLNPTVVQTTATSSNVNQIFQWEEALISSGLLFREGNTLQRIDLNSVRTAFGNIASSTTCWYAENATTVWQYGNKTLTRHKNDTEIFSAPVTQPLTAILQANENRVIASNGSHLVLLTVLDKNKVEEKELPLSHLSLTQDQEYYLAWQDGELWAISPEGTANLINRLSSDITNVIPLTESGTLLIATKNKLYTFHPRYYITHELVQAENIENVSVIAQTRQIFFVGTKDGKRAVWQLGY